jgi:hypothetical protein
MSFEMGIFAIELLGASHLLLQQMGALLTLYQSLLEVSAFMSRALICQRGRSIRIRMTPNITRRLIIYTTRLTFVIKHKHTSTPFDTISPLSGISSRATPVFDNSTSCSSTAA